MATHGGSRQKGRRNGDKHQRRGHVLPRGRGTARAGRGGKNSLMLYLGADDVRGIIDPYVAYTAGECSASKLFGRGQRPSPCHQDEREGGSCHAARWGNTKEMDRKKGSQRTAFRGPRTLKKKVGEGIRRGSGSGQRAGEGDHKRGYEQSQDTGRTSIRRI